MTVGEAVEVYITDMRAKGRINSVHTERAYRAKLERHVADADDRDVARVDRRHVWRTLRRWEKLSTRRQAWAILSSFYEWTVERGLRADNPVAQTARPEREMPAPRKLTTLEAQALLKDAGDDWRDERVAYLALCAGLRVSEIPSLHGQHVTRERGWLWVPRNVGKHGERWVPMTRDLEAVAEMWVEPLALTYAGIHKRVGRLAKRVGVRGVTPQVMRTTFAAQMYRYVGAPATASMLGSMYRAEVPARVDDETAARVRAFSYWTAP